MQERLEIQWLLWRTGLHLLRCYGDSANAIATDYRQERQVRAIQGGTQRLAQNREQKAIGQILSVEGKQVAGPNPR